MEVQRIHSTGNTKGIHRKYKEGTKETVRGY